MEDRPASPTAPEHAPNPRQQEAIDYIDGPLLVLAGPGTGKTELLSRRTKNILDKRDVAAKNILCLTFTNRGADTMRRRLIRDIGREAYGVEIGTFHAFAQNLRGNYPEYFNRSAEDALVTELQSQKILESILASLPQDDLLYETPKTSIIKSKDSYRRSNRTDIKAFIDKFRHSGISANQFRSIVSQTDAFMEYMTNAINAGQLAFPSLRGKLEAKYSAISEFIDSLHDVIDSAPAALKDKDLVTTPGVYEPYAETLARAFSDPDELIDENGKTAVFGERRDKLFAKDNAGNLYLTGRQTCRKARSAIDVYERYREELAQSHLYDFDDMIADAITALEDSAEFRMKVQDRYLYIQIDEFQDTNGAQMRMVELMTQGIDRPNLMVVGDDDQSIMRFQGASVTYISQFKSLYQAHEVNLEENYRSLPAIVGLGQYVVRQIETRHDQNKKLVAHKEHEEVAFEVLSCPSRETQYAELAQDIAQRMNALKEKGDVDDKAIAVIARQNKTLANIIPYLAAHDIPFSYRYTATVAEMEVMQTLLALLCAIHYYAQGRSKRADEYLPQVIASVELNLDPEACLGFAVAANCEEREKRAANGSDSAWMRALSKSPNEQLRALYRTIERLSARAAATPIYEIIYAAAQPIMEYYQGLQEHDPYAFVQFNYGVKALIDFVAGEQVMSSVLENHPLRLSDVIERLEEIERLGLQIPVDINIARKGAVTLTTAHSSKGDEYDFVYLVDADEDSWHSRGSSDTILTRNMLFADRGDEDDDRRLVFVALTRPKYGIKTYLGKGSLTRELIGAPNIQIMDMTIDASSLDEMSKLADATQKSWYKRFSLTQEDFLGTLKPDIENMKMSPSRLNAFVTYVEGCKNSTDFVDFNIIRLPQRPSVSLDFGSVVHDFLETYVVQFFKGKVDLSDLVPIFQHRLRLMDYADKVIINHLYRFELIVQQFIPQLDMLLEQSAGSTPHVEKWINTEVDGVPLVGACDLILKNNQTHEIKVFDYKTGKNKSEERPDANYHRQLCFYKILIENSPQFAGYTVSDVANLYVEPIKDKDETGHVTYRIGDVARYPVSEQDVQHVRELIGAVWRRIQNGLFDTSDFETSEILLEAKALSTTKAGKSKNLGTEEVQRLYEDWLIAKSC
ncbi:MAG: UvrD-helicase domain-containing protein [Coriobacteriaceae bacterium]|nr:UvrD-helicase domain-containing protein [Coriobacteriaceae bacterium]